MTKKIEFWLVCATFAFVATLSRELIDISSGTAIPVNTGKSTNRVIDRLTFVVNSSGKQQPRTEGKRRTKVAGSRGCGTEIVALIPQSNLGVTLSTHPTLWFYLAPSNVDVKSIQFRLMESTSSLESDIWTTQLLPEPRRLEAGLLQVKYQGKPLTNGTYRWELRYQQVSCDRAQTLTGYLQKETYPQLATVENSRARSISYAKNGIWHELLTDLIEQRQQQPANSRSNTDFRSLFFESEDIKYRLPTDETQIDRDLMEQIVQARVIDCCQFIGSK